MEPGPYRVLFVDFFTYRAHTPLSRIAVASSIGTTFV